jgi:signal transduction histidine kinase/NO-binding membrane sensor protein with MHYT domain/ActR/RegA family two-component response regulator
MFEFVTCLEQHDPRELSVAVVICLMSVFAGLSAYRRARLAEGRFRLAWLALLGFLLGGGVWATHFMAMLAFRKHTPAIFGLDLTLLSLIVACGGFFIGGSIAARSHRRVGQAIGGTLFGVTITAMHFIGISAMRFPARLTWNPALVAVAIAVGLAGSAAALVAAGDRRNLRAALSGGGLLCLAICGLHFTAMAAVTLTPAPLIHGAGFYSSHGLAMGVGALAGVVLMCGAGVLMMDGMGKAATLSALRAALNQVPCAISFFDRDLQLIFWNQNFASLLALYGVEARRGLPHSILLGVADAHGVQHRPEGLSSLTGAGGTQVFSVFQTPDGRWFEARSNTTRDGGYVAVMNDITAQRELIDKQAQAQAQAEQVSRSKSEFLANTSHEIRTPLNALLGMVQVMERNDLDAAQRRRLQIVAESGRSLLAVLNSVLDLAKIEAGKFELDEQAFDLVRTVQQAVSGFEPLAAQKELRLSVEVEPGAAGVWRGDRDRLRQVLSNLVSNAIKFTPQGHVSVRAACADEGLRFVVEDSGVGVAPEKHALIFAAFEQADASTTRQFGGTGLGLAICSELVRAMGGRLTVRSELNAGAEFAFVLPLQRLEDADAPAPASSDLDVDLPLRILVAEDNPTNQLVLSALLEPFGVVLTLADDGAAAVAAFAAGGFDAVLMDVQMPRMNGIQAAAEIRRIEREQGLGRAPIIALTANVMNHQVQEYLAAGMDGFVAKPIQLSELLTALAARPPRSASVAA